MGVGVLLTCLTVRKMRKRRRQNSAYRPRDEESDQAADCSAPPREVSERVPCFYVSVYFIVVVVVLLYRFRDEKSDCVECCCGR
jgi:hypothetical protein